MWQNAGTKDFLNFFLFIQEDSNDDLGLTLSFSIAKSNLLSVLLYGNRSWIL